MVERPELAPDVVSAQTGLHPGKIGRDIGQGPSQLEPRELAPQYDGVALFLTNRRKLLQLEPALDRTKPLRMHQ
jgi:hypothetical protein